VFFFFFFPNLKENKLKKLTIIITQRGKGTKILVVIPENSPDRSNSPR